MKICPNCNKQNPDAFTHCSCGEDLSIIKSVENLKPTKEKNNKKVFIFILLVFVVILSLFVINYILDKQSVDLSQQKSFSDFSKEEKYLATLPIDISLPMEYVEVLNKKGSSQYSYQENFPLEQSENEYLYYDAVFLDKACIVGLVFEEQYLAETRYIYKAVNDSGAKRLFNSLCDKLITVIGNPIYDYENNYGWGVYGDNFRVNIFKVTETVYIDIEYNDKLTGKPVEYETYATQKSVSTTTTAYEWKLNTNSDGYDWCNADETEKEVWCSNSFASWRLMGYDIPSSASQSVLKSYLDEFYKDTSNRSVDLVTATEVYAELKGIY